MPLSIGTSCDGSMVIVIYTLEDLVFLLSLDFLCLSNDENNYQHAHNRHIRGREGEREGGEYKGGCSNLLVIYTHILLT